MTEQQRQQYFKQQDTIESLFAFHPEYFDHLTQDDMRLLDTYYFLGREIDVDDIADYAASLERTNPGTQQHAEAAFRKALEPHLKAEYLDVV
jgi:hypothetical protein